MYNYGHESRGGRTVVQFFGRGRRGAEAAPAEQGGAALAAMVRRVLEQRPTMRFYWRSTTNPCGRHPGNPTSAELGRAMNAIERSLCTVSGVRKLDGYNWTKGEHLCAFYDDALHHPRLAFAHVATWLEAECPPAPPALSSTILESRA